MPDQHLWAIFDFGGVVLTMCDKSHYLSGMQEVMRGVGYASMDAAAFKKRVYGGPEFAEAKEGRITSDEMWRRIFSDPNLLSKSSASSLRAPSSVLSESQLEQSSVEDSVLSPVTSAVSPAAASLESSESVEAVSPLTDEIIKRYRDKVRVEGRHVHPRFVEYVRGLRQRGVRVAVLSNYESDLLEVMDTLGIRNEFDGDHHILSSHHLGVAKPKLNAFEVALQRLEIAPTRAPSFCKTGSDGLTSVASTSSSITDATTVQSFDSPSYATPQGGFVESAAASTHTSEPACCVAFPNVVFIDDKESNVLAAKRFGIAHGVVYTSLDQCIRDVDAAIREMERTAAS